LQVFAIYCLEALRRTKYTLHKTNPKNKTALNIPYAQNTPQLQYNHKQTTQPNKPHQQPTQHTD
jgi:hypothetical protein